MCYMETQLPSPKSGWSPLSNFRPISIVAKRLDGSRWHLARRWSRPHWARRGPSSLSKRGRVPQFLAIFIVVKRLSASRCHLDGGKPQPRQFCVRWGPSPLPKMKRSRPIFGPRLLWPNAAWIKMHLYGGRPRPTRHCVRSGPSSPSPKWAQSTMSVVAKQLN